MSVDQTHNENIQAIKSTVIHDLFVKTADENYLTARWCFEQNLRIDFKWLALHALEKYLKAALLINGKSAKNYGHNLLAPFRDLQKIAAPLLPASASDLEPFLIRLERYGNPHNRYNLYGNVHESTDLALLDSAVFSVRRLIWPLDEITDSDRTFRETLATDPGFRVKKQGSTLDLALTDEHHTLHHVACNRNVLFAPAYYKHSAASGWLIAGSNSMITMSILDPMQGAQSEADARIAAALVDWMLNSVHLSREDQEELKTSKKDTFRRLRIDE